MHIVRVKASCSGLLFSISSQIKDLNASKAKFPYKSVAEVDERVRYGPFSADVAMAA